MLLKGLKGLPRRSCEEFGREETDHEAMNVNAEVSQMSRECNKGAMEVGIGSSEPLRDQILPPAVSILVDWFLHARIRTGDRGMLSRARFTVSLSLVLAVCALVYAIIFLLMHCTIGSMTLAVGIGAILINVVLLRWFGSCFLASHALTAIFYAVVTILACRQGGHGAPATSWYTAILLVPLCTLGRRSAALWFAILAVSMASFYALDRAGYTLSNDLTSHHFELLKLLSSLGLAAVIFCVAMLYETAKNQMFQWRAQADRAAVQLADFERLITEIAAGLVRLSAGEVDAGIERALACVGAFTGADRAYVFLLRDGAVLAENTHEWCADGIRSEIANLKAVRIAEELPWFCQYLGRQQVFYQPSVAEIPAEGKLERQHFSAQGIQSLLVVPMALGDRLIGFLGFDAVRKTRSWSDREQVLLRLIGDTFVNAIERKRAEAALRESEEQFRRFAAASGHGLTISDLTGKLVFANPAALQLFQAKSLQDVCGNSLYHYMLGADAVRLQNEVMPCVMKNGQWTGELTVASREGQPIATEQNIFLIPDESGMPRMVGNIISDISERKRAETELERAKYDAEAASRAKSDFLANMSHEIRTPMTAILGFSDVMLETVTDLNQVETLAIIKRNGEYLLEILDGILDISKVEAGKLEVEHIPCSPHQIVTEVVSLMKVRASHKMLSLEVQFESAIPESILTDPTRLRQILINIIGNAIKFTDEGYVRIAVRVVDAGDNEPKLQIDVCDSGPGIDENRITDLFQPFCQADTSTTRKFGGTGLGLTISRRLAEKLGGNVTVESTVGKGSTFKITVGTGLLKEAALEASAQVVPAVRVADKNGTAEVGTLACRVLLAEDGIDNQRLIAFLLRKAGADVVVAENGQLACELALAARDEGNPFDMILMDIQMPVMDGCEATRRLRAAGYDQPIVALTAHAMLSDQSKCREAGCNYTMTKPIDRETLVRTVARFAVSETRERIACASRGELIALCAADQQSYS
jgi:PAS domain S-box-containing protein